MKQSLEGEAVLFDLPSVQQPFLGRNLTKPIWRPFIWTCCGPMRMTVHTLRLGVDQLRNTIIDLPLQSAASYIQVGGPLAAKWSEGLRDRSNRSNRSLQGIEPEIHGRSWGIPTQQFSA